MTPAEAMQRIDDLLSHVWMVRTFLKHSDEAQEEDDLGEVHRKLYEYMLALGEPLKRGDAEEYVRQARKKLAKLRGATELFRQVQPEISTHTNFQMAARSLTLAAEEIGAILSRVTPSNDDEQRTTEP
jgi:hypothetical protein